MNEITNCSRSLNPDGYLSLDETLYSCRIQIGFRQYNPSKPSKYGLLFKSINSVKSPFTHRAIVYAGCPTGVPGQYYVPGVTPQVKTLVEGLSAHCALDGNNITMDRLYTNYEILEWLLARKMERMFQ